MFGMANGLITIARGAVPLALFGAAGYGHLMGRIGGPFLVMQAIAPLVLAFVAERTSDPAVLAVVAAFALLAFAALAAIRRSRKLHEQRLAEQRVDVVLGGVAGVAARASGR